MGCCGVASASLPMAGRGSPPSQHRRSSDQTHEMIAIVLLTFTFLILANAALIVRLFGCYAPTIIRSFFVADLSRREKRSQPHARIKRDVAPHAPADFRQRLAQYLDCNETDLVNHRPAAKSSMTFWAASKSFDGLAPKSSRYIRFILRQIRRLVARGER